MTTTIDTHGSHTRPVGATAVVSALVATAFTISGANEWQELLIVLPILAVTTAVVFGVVVPRSLRRPSAGGTALALSIPALVLVLPVFWSAIPFVLGAAGALLGDAGRRASTGAGKSIAALVIGVLAMVAYLIIYVGDLMSGGGGFLFD